MRVACLVIALLVLGGNPARADRPVTIFAAASTMEAVNAVARAYEAGGRGAVREAIEHLLKGMGRWDDALSRME